MKFTVIGVENYTPRKGSVWAFSLKKPIGHFNIMPGMSNVLFTLSSIFESTNDIDHFVNKLKEAQFYILSKPYVSKPDKRGCKTLEVDLYYGDNDD